MRKAAYVVRDDEGRITCQLCPHQCRIPEGGHGLCHVRARQGDRIIAQNYASVTALALDPIEKKPLYHFYPGATVLSVGTNGCNLACSFCQNWRIAQRKAEGREISPQELTELAKRYVEDGNIGVAFTYSEPAVWWEFMTDTTPLVREAGLKNVMVTNGFLSPEPWEALIPYLDAVNLDIKGFTDDFYRRHCRGSLEPVLQTARRLAGRVHLEITTLLIPGENDSEDEIKRLVQWIADTLGPDTPLHFTRYFPQYKMDLPPTEPERLEDAYQRARERLHYVYLGNMADSERSDTICPRCGNLWIKRSGFGVYIPGLTEGKCSQCGLSSPIVGS